MDICNPSVKKDGRLKNLITGRYYDYMFYALTNSGRYFTVISDMALGVYMTFNDLYVITPVQSKTRNYGFDGTGVCCQNIAEINNKSSLTYDYTLQTVDSGNGQEVIIIQDDETFLMDNKKIFDDFLVTDVNEKRKVDMLIWAERILGRKNTVKLCSILKEIKNGK